MRLCTKKNILWCFLHYHNYTRLKDVNLRSFIPDIIETWQKYLHNAWFQHIVENYQTAVNNRAMVTRIPEDGRGRFFPSSGGLLQQFTRDDDPVMQIKPDVDGRERWLPFQWSYVEI